MCKFTKDDMMMRTPGLSSRFSQKFIIDDYNDDQVRDALTAAMFTSVTPLSHNVCSWLEFFNCRNVTVLTLWYRSRSNTLPQPVVRNGMQIGSSSSSSSNSSSSSRLGVHM